GQGDPRVPRRWLEDHGLRPELPRSLRLFDHREGDAVLQRARRVLPLELRPQPNLGLGRQALNADEGRVAHGLEDVVRSHPPIIAVRSDSPAPSGGRTNGRFGFEGRGYALG